MSNPLPPKTLQEAIRYFSDEETCIQAVAAARWPQGAPQCPACLHTEHYYLKTQRRWKCKECGRQFSVKLGTIFEDSPVPLNKWLVAVWMLANCKNGVSSYEIHRALGVTQKTAWFMLHRIRLAFKGYDLGTKAGGPGHEVEIDETFVGGKVKFMHRSRFTRFERQTALLGKTPVMGVLDRETRQMRAKVVPNVKRETLQAEVLNLVKYGSTVYTDNAVAYDNLNHRYVHDVVNHIERYVKGRVHTNGLENFWSLFKRELGGTYIAVEPFHLFRYLDEQVFRYNNRKTKKRHMDDADRFRLALSQVAHKRLTYAELTGKVGETPAA